MISLSGSVLQIHFVFAELYRIQGYEDYKTPWSMIFATAIASIMMAIALWQVSVFSLRWFRKPTDSPLGLINLLIRNHRLNSVEAKLVKEFVSKLPQAIPGASVFVDSSIWDDDSIIPQSEQKQSLKKKLFG